MLTKMTDFGKKRTWGQAIFFYIFYVITTLILSYVIAIFLALIINRLDPEIGWKIGTITAIASSAIISLLILKTKKLMAHVGFLTLALLSALAAFLGGGILGFLIPAYLTTRNAPIKKGKR